MIKVFKKTFFFLYCLLCFTTLYVSAQTKFQISELNITNDGEGRTIATIRKTKVPVDGKIVIIDNGVKKGIWTTFSEDGTKTEQTY